MSKRGVIVLVCAAAVASTAWAADKHPGEYLNVIHTSYETPHVTWAKPYARGPLRALFLVPRREAARDVVELWQRIDLEFEAVTTFNSTAMGADNRYDDRVEGTSSEEKREELRAKLERDYDVIVIANFDFDAIPTEFQYQILRKVVDGAGLVFTHYRGTELDLFRKRIEDAPGMLCDGIPFSGLPWWPEGFIEEKGLAGVGDIPQALISTWQLGKGRLAVVDWGAPPATRYGAPGMAPALGYAPELPTYYDYCHALLARVLYWASGSREPQVRLTGLGCEALPLARAETGQARVEFVAENLGQEPLTASLSHVIRAPDGTELAGGEQRVSLAPGASDLSVALPAGLPHGDCFLDLRVVSERGVEAWASRHIAVESPLHIADLGLASEIVEPASAAEGTLTLSAGAPANSSLTFELADTTGRVFLRQTSELAEGATEAPYELSLAGLTTQAAYLSAELGEGDASVHRTRAPVFAPVRRPDEYVNLVWGARGGEGLSHYHLQMLREAGFNTYLQHPTETRARYVCLHDFHYVPYSWRICGGANEQGVRVAGFGPKTDDDSFSNPEYRQTCHDAIIERLGPTPDYRPLVYSLGDENNFDYRSGYGPHDVVAFREYVKEQYQSIGDLNQSWGTAFGSWDEVAPLPIQEAVGERKFAARHDHMSFLEQQYGDFHRFLRACIREVDPEGWVGAEGSQPGDLEKSVEGLELWSPYYRHRDDVLLQAIAPKSLIRGNWWGGYVASHGGRPRTPLTFDQLLRGLNTNFWYAAGEGSEGLTAVGFGYAEYFERLLPGLREVTGGIGKLLTEAEPVFDGVGIHWSQASEHACGFDGRYGQTRSSHEALIAALERLVINPTYVTTKQLETGGLVERGLKIIFLPTSLAISDAEAVALEEFVTQGGVVLADMGVGLMDGHCKPLEHGRLDGLLGVTTAPEDPVEIEGHVRINPSFEPTNVDDVEEVDGTPLMTDRKLGAGRALAQNFGLGSLGALGEDVAEGLLLQALDLAGAAPTVKRTDAPNWRVRLLQSGDMRILGVWRVQGEEGPPQVTLPAEHFVYEARSGKAIGRTGTIRPPAGDTDVFIYTLFQEEPRPIRVRVPEAGTPGEPLEVRLSVPGATPGRVVRLEALGPDGKAIEQLRQVFVLQDASARRAMYPAFNDPPGKWTIRATDVATGMTDEVQVTVG